MNFQETVDYLFELLPMYQRAGNIAFKNDLTNTIKLCEALGNPQDTFKSIHIGGTNGKGSSAHLLQALFMEAGYRTGMYTSPHLKIFTERIQLNARHISEAFVVDFVDRNSPLIHEIKPSFFELTVAMAFQYFADMKVDVAIIEVGLGGRLDSTNIIHPELALITNISMDHMDLLGDTKTKIAAEKAGIIKENTPVIIGESDPVTEAVFLKQARSLDAPIIFAETSTRVSIQDDMIVFSDGSQIVRLEKSLIPDYQVKNIPGVLCVVKLIEKKFPKLKAIALSEVLKRYFKHPTNIGRWQVLSKAPLTICDTAHNEAGVKLVLNQLLALKYDTLHIIWGMVKEKDVRKILRLLPVEASYTFCQSSIPRALDALSLATLAREVGLHGDVVKDVNTAIRSTRAAANVDDVIFVGGSTFVVAEIDEL